MVSPGSASMVHLHSPLLPRPPAVLPPPPPPPPAPGESPPGKSKLEMRPLEPLRVPPHVSSAVSHQRETPTGEGKGEERGSKHTLPFTSEPSLNVSMIVDTGRKTSTGLTLEGMKDSKRLWSCFVKGEVCNIWICFKRKQQHQAEWFPSTKAYRWTTPYIYIYVDVLTGCAY